MLFTNPTLLVLLLGIKVQRDHFCVKIQSLNWIKEWKTSIFFLAFQPETWSTREKGWITEVFLSVTYSSQRKNPKEKLVSSVASLFKTPCSLLSYCAPKKKSYFNYVFWRISKNASKFTCPIIHCRFRKFGLFECKFNQFATLINLKNHSFFQYRNGLLWLFL